MKSFPTLFFAAAFSLLTAYASAQNSVSILNFSASSTGGGVGVADNGFFETFDDGDTNTIGDQTTPVQSDNFLDALPDISAGSITLSGIMLNNDAIALNGDIFSTTTGGQISLFDDNDLLLLSGELGEQILSGAETGGSTPFASGAFFSSGTDNGITFTGGSLLPFLASDSGGLSIILSDIQTNGIAGLTVSGGTIADFTANASGQITASSSGVAVPEPTTLPLLILGFALFSGTRRRSAV